jgi:D-glycero-alpha-D-manno-heptose-7-phosphate kinase
MYELKPKIVRARAPLRIGFAGGGTDVSPYCDIYGGMVLNATIDRYAYATIEITDSQEVEFSAVDRAENWRVPFDAFNDQRSCPLKLHAAVYRRVIHDFNSGRPLSLRLTTYSDAPAGSGLGTSSTLVVAMVAAFRELLHLPLGDYEIAQLAFQIERVDEGLAGGMQDQYAASFGGFNFIEFYDAGRVIVNPLRVRRWFINEIEASSLLYFTGLSRESANIINDQIASSRSDTSRALQALHDVKSQSLLMKEAVLRCDFMMLVNSVRMGWESKKLTSSLVSNSIIDTACKVAIDCGALSLKVSGAGGGGFMYILVDPAKRGSVSDAMRSLGGHVSNCHFTEHGVQSWRVS